MWTTSENEKKRKEKGLKTLHMQERVVHSLGVGTGWQGVFKGERTHALTA